MIKGFKVGDKIRRTQPANFPDFHGKMGEVYEVLENRRGSPVIIHIKNPTSDPTCFEFVALGNQTGGDEWEFYHTGVKVGTISTACFEFFDLSPTQSGRFQTARPNISAHDCSANLKTYDSGWSRYDYCSICDKKLT